MIITLPDHDLEMAHLQEEGQDIVIDHSQETDQLNQKEEDQESHQGQEIVYQGIENLRDQGIVFNIIEMHRDQETESNRLGGEKTGHILGMMIKDLEVMPRVLVMEVSEMISK